MSQDFAKTRKTANKSSKKKPARSATRPASTENKPWSWFYSGLFTGILLSVIAYFLPAQLRPDQGASNTIAVNPGEQTTEESGTDLDFYEYLPQAEVVVNVVPVEIAESALQEEIDPVTYFLQAGSFLDPNDAEATIPNPMSKEAFTTKRIRIYVEQILAAYNKKQAVAATAASTDASTQAILDAVVIDPV